MTTFGLINESSKSLVPLKGIKVHCKVRDFFGQVSITQHYRNDQEIAITAKFVFPLDSQCTVNSFEVWAGEKHIVGGIKEKKEAKEEFKKEIQKGNTVAKMEKKSGDIFQVAIGNIQPNETCIVLLKYVQELDTRGKNNVIVDLPKTIGPKYVPQDVIEDENEKNIMDTLSKYQFSGYVCYGTKYEFDFEMKNEIEALNCGDHPLDYELIKNKCKFQYEPTEEEFNKSIHLEIKVKGLCEPRAIVEETENGQKFAACAFYPDLSEQEVNTEIIFVIDRSGSMSGKRMDFAREALSICLHSLTVTCYFNIVGFGSDFKFLFENGSVAYNQKNLKRAKEHVKGMSANLGGTEILKPLNEIFLSDSKEGFSRQIFLITDGEVSNTQAVISKVRKNRSNTRVFTFGIGHGASSELVKGVAMAGGGKSCLIKDNENIRKKVLKQLDYCLQPTVTDLRFEIKDLPQPLIVAPYKLPPLFFKTKYVIYLLLDGDKMGHLKLKGQTANGSVEWDLVIDPSACEGGNLISSLAAKKMIENLENRTSKYHDNNFELKNDIKQSTVDNEIISLSKNYNILSKMTSYIAVIENNNKNEKENEMIPIMRVPISDLQKSNNSSSSIGSYSSSSYSMSGYGGGYRGIMVGMGQKDSYIGDEAQSKRGILTLHYPIEQGIVTNWDNMEKILHHTFYNELRVAPEEHPVIITESPLNPKANKERMTQIMFETFNVPALFLVDENISIICSHGMKSGIVVHFGSSIIQVTAVYRFEVLKQTSLKMNFGGDRLTKYLGELLLERGYSLTTKAEREIVGDIKEKLCYVALDFDQEMQDSRKASAIERDYELPDGQIITLGNELFRSTEPLFQPSLIGENGKGLAECIAHLLLSCKEEIRDELAQHILLEGGTSLLPKINDRIYRDVQSLIKNDLPDLKIKVQAIPERKFSNWIGGSILLSLTSFMEAGITSDEYDQTGPTIIHESSKRVTECLQKLYKVYEKKDEKKGEKIQEENKNEKEEEVEEEKLKKKEEEKKKKEEEEEEEEWEGLVLDCGSSFIKAGFAGDDAPRAIFPSIVGRPRHYGVMVGMGSYSSYSPSSSTTVTKVIKKKPKYDDIIDLQFALGYWELNEKIAKLIDLNLKAIQDSKPNEINDQMWITLVVIAAFQKKWLKNKIEWSLVVKKAKKWIKSQKNVDYQKLLSLAEKLF
ncbi:von willebrand factor a domain-containing protein 5a [Anaeramoeba flamelloides]|uniref:von willebrand factor a domain-containing protein 5a n=1 Tax=Anaeramoeba flamelloides TaxID=1746091 RepID=A0ABQ8ZBR5_9EUKA|nr:von willebrand factor a domain-containing protein 5a [Anaeramoeba flamelloides]